MGYDGTLKFDTSVNTTGFQTGVSKIGTLAGTAFKATTAVIGAAATAIGAFGVSSLKAGMNFDSAMSNVAAISGATGGDLDALTAKAQEMGAKTKFSASEAADAFSYMAMAGWKTGDMLNGIEGIMNLAAASGADLATTSDIVTDALTAFGLSAQDSAHFADIMAAASSNANTNVELMGETFKYVAPVAGALGFTAEDTAVAIGLMANAGIKGSQAGTALRSVFTRLAKPTKQSQKALDALGLSLTDDAGNVKDLNVLLGEMRVKFSTLTDAEKAEYAALLAGQEGMSGLLAIVNASDEDMAKLTDAVDGCTDELTGYSAAAEMAARQMDNLKGDVTILKSALEGFQIAISRGMNDTARGVVQEITGMVNELNDAFGEGGMGALVTKAGEIFGRLATEALQAAPSLIDAAVNLVSAFLDSITNSDSEFASAAGTVVAKLAEAFITVSGKLWSAGVELLRKMLEGLAENASDIGRAAGTAVGNLANSIRENAPLIVQAAKDIIAGFCEGLSEEFPGVAALLEGFFSGFIDTISGIAGGVADILSGIFEAINGADPATMKAIGEALGTIAAALVTISTLKSVVSVISGVAGAFKGGVSFVTKFAAFIPKIVEGFQLWAGGAGTFTEVIALEFPKLGAIIAKVGTFFSSVGSAISTALSAVGEFFATFGAAIAGVAAVIGGAIMAVVNFVDMFKNGFQIIKEILMVLGIAIAAVGAVILGAPAAIAAAVAGIIAAVATLVIVIKDHWNEICEFFKNLAGAIVDFFKDLPNKISAAVQAVGEWVSNLWNTIVTGVSGAVQATINFFASLPERIGTFLSNVITAITEWGASVLEFMSTAASNAINAVVTFFSELPYKIGYAIGFVIGTLISWGASIVNWIMTNVPIWIDNIVKFFSELPGKIWTFLTTIVTNVIQWGAQMLTNLTTTAQNCFNAVVNWFSQLPGRLWTFFTDIITKAIQWGSQLLTNMQTAAMNAFNAVVNWFSQLPGRIWNFLTTIITNVIQWGSQLLSNMQTAAQNAINAVINWFQQLPGKIKEFLSQVVSAVASWASDLAAKGAAAAKALFDSVVNGVKELPGKMLEIGKNIVDGVWKGICDAKDEFFKNVKNFFSGLVDGAKDALGIKSPSRIMARSVGRWIPPGVAQGMEKAMPELIDTAESEMQELAEHMRATVELETGAVTQSATTQAQHRANIEGEYGGTNYYYDTFEQSNTYNVPVATPSEIAKTQRETARNLLGGVK